MIIPEYEVQAYILIFTLDIKVGFAPLNKPRKPYVIRRYTEWTSIV